MCLRSRPARLKDAQGDASMSADVSSRKRRGADLRWPIYDPACRDGGWLRKATSRPPPRGAGASAGRATSAAISGSTSQFGLCANASRATAAPRLLSTLAGRPVTLAGVRYAAPAGWSARRTYTESVVGVHGDIKVWLAGLVLRFPCACLGPTVSECFHRSSSRSWTPSWTSRWPS